MSAPLSPRADRLAYREAVATIAAKAKEKLPECNGRVEKAVKLVLAGDVALLDTDRAEVASMTNPTATYLVGNGVCACVDCARAPHGLCAHRLAVAMARRVHELLAALPAPAPEAPAEALPEAPASVNVHLTISGRHGQLTLRDTDETRLLARLETVLQQYPLPEKTPEPGEGWCKVHNVSMRQTTKDGRTWYSHKTEQGWCKGGQRG